MGYRDRNTWRDSHRNKKADEAGKYVDEIIRLAVIKDPDWKELLRDGGLVDSFVKNKELKLKDLKSTQLRKFFEQVRQLKDKALNKNVEWKEIEADLWMIVPSLKYANGRNLVPPAFLNFVIKGIEAVYKGSNEEEKRELLLNFIKVFEAVVAYHKYYYHSKE